MTESTRLGLCLGFGLGLRRHITKRTTHSRGGFWARWRQISFARCRFDFMVEVMVVVVIMVVIVVIMTVVIMVITVQAPNVRSCKFQMLLRKTWKRLHRVRTRN
jgi:hypothetical protein